MFIEIIITNLSSLSGGEASMPRNRFVPGPEYQTVRSRIACKKASLVVFIEKHRYPSKKYAKKFEGAGLQEYSVLSTV
jgi:hypothetical protein